MEIEVLQKRLSKALNTVSRVAVSTRAGLPILSNVLLRAEKKQLILTATNLEIATVEYVNAEVKKSGTITVPAKLIAEFVSNLPSEETVKLKAKGDKLTISAGKYKSTINGILADDFPREWVGTRIRHSVPPKGCGAAAITNDFVASNAIVLVTGNTHITSTYVALRGSDG